MIKFLRRTYKLLTCHKLLKMPEDIKKMKTNLIILSVCFSAFTDFLTFALKGAQSFAAQGKTILCVLCLILYFGKSLFQSIYSTMYDLRSSSFDNIYKSKINTVIMDVVEVTREKVYKDENLMTTSDLIFATKYYLDLVHNFWWRLPEDLSNFVTLIVMTISLMFIEFRDTQDIKLTASFFFILLGCVIIYIILLKIRLKKRDLYRETRRQLKKDEDNYLNDLRNITPLETRDFDFHAFKLKNCISKTVETMRKLDLDLNLLFIIRSIVLAFFMCLITILKVKGKSLTPAVILDVVAVTTVYNTILDKIQNILFSLEGMIDRANDIQTYFKDFNLITETYDEENGFEESTSIVNQITVKPFIYTYKGTKNVFQLLVENAFTLSKKDIVLVRGHTGCGKSTLMKLLTGKKKLKNSPISFGHTNGYLNSIMLESRSILGCNNVLSEIILSDDTFNFDVAKLLHILKGITLYDDLIALLHLPISATDSEKNNAVLNYLRQNVFKEFSTGQQQRLLIAKVLFNLKDQQILAFDEVTSGLDDETAKKVLKFICEFSQDSFDRIILFATHQIGVTKEFCNKQITFEADAPYSKVSCTNISNTSI